MNHKRSKCLFFKEGSVFNEDCTKTIAHCYCEIDEMEEDKPCTSDACRYYVRKEEGRRRVVSAKRKPVTNPRTVIRCGTEDDAKLAYLAMFRYAFGCQTYMPGVVIGIIKANANHLTMPTLFLLDRELTEEAGRYERVHKDSGKPYSNYGMDCDRRAWLAFHEWVKAEIAKKEANDDD